MLPAKAALIHSIKRAPKHPLCPAEGVSPRQQLSSSAKSMLDRQGVSMEPPAAASSSQASQGAGSPAAGALLADDRSFQGSEAPLGLDMVIPLAGQSRPCHGHQTMADLAGWVFKDAPQRL